jgi:hypothetical protein
VRGKPDRENGRRWIRKKVGEGGGGCEKEEAMRKVFFIRNYDVENRNRFSNFIIFISLELSERATAACEKAGEMKVKIM